MRTQTLGRARCPRCGKSGAVIIKTIGDRHYVYLRHGRKWCYIGPIDREDVWKFLKSSLDEEAIRQLTPLMKKHSIVSVFASRIVTICLIVSIVLAASGLYLIHLAFPSSTSVLHEGTGGRGLLIGRCHIVDHHLRCTLKLGSTTRTLLVTLFPNMSNVPGISPSLVKTRLINVQNRSSSQSEVKVKNVSSSARLTSTGSANVGNSSVSGASPRMGHHNMRTERPRESTVHAENGTDIQQWPSARRNIISTILHMEIKINKTAKRALNKLSNIVNSINISNIGGHHKRVLWSTSLYSISSTIHNICSIRGVHPEEKTRPDTSHGPRIEHWTMVRPLPVEDTSRSSDTRDSVNPIHSILLHKVHTAENILGKVRKFINSIKKTTRTFIDNMLNMTHRKW